MYSVVLMMALSGSGETVGLGHRCSGCASTHGCTTKVVATTCSSSCHSRHSCHGGGLFNRCHHSCSSASHSTCTAHVATKCSTSCHSSRCHGGLFSRHGCHGCSATVVCSGCSGATTEKAKTMKTEGKTDGKKEEEASNASPATIVVALPASAKLTVDGNATRSISDRRTFVTPALANGEAYVYTLQAEVVRDGQAAVQTQTVTVRGGQTTEVSFTFASQGVASR